MTQPKPVGSPHGNKTHGQSRSREWSTWQQMKQRCANPKDKGYANYGQRGIQVCDRWLHSFEHFLSDMGPKPIGYSIERKNNELGYGPENCLWIPRGDQNKNRRQNHWFTFRGKNQIIADWAREYGFTHHRLWTRLIEYRWPIEKALLTPIMSSSQSGHQGAAIRWK